VENKVIVVSGATSGIGLACVQALAAAGCTVAGFGRSAAKTAALLPDLQQAHGAGQVDLQALDVRADDAVERFVATVLATHGRIDGLVNAAGLLRMEKAHQVSRESWSEQMDVLLGGTFFLTQRVLEPMRRQKSGLVVNIGSVSGTRAAPGMAVYGAAKAAVEHLTKSLAAEYAAHGIRFLCLNPGPVATALMAPLMYEMLARKVPLQRVGQPAEVGHLVRYLFSDEAGFMTGSTITMDGGAAL